jgi:hypothetical protein
MRWEEKKKNSEGEGGCGFLDTVGKPGTGSLPLDLLSDRVLSVIQILRPLPGPSCHPGCGGKSQISLLPL